MSTTSMPGVTVEYREIDPARTRGGEGRIAVIPALSETERVRAAADPRIPEWLKSGHTMSWLHLLRRQQVPDYVIAALPVLTNGAWQPELWLLAAHLGQFYLPDPPFEVYALARACPRCRAPIGMSCETRRRTRKGDLHTQRMNVGIAHYNRRYASWPEDRIPGRSYYNDVADPPGWVAPELAWGCPMCGASAGVACSTRLLVDPVVSAYHPERA